VQEQIQPRLSSHHFQIKRQWTLGQRHGMLIVQGLKGIEYAEVGLELFRVEKGKLGWLALEVKTLPLLVIEVESSLEMP